MKEVMKYLLVAVFFFVGMRLVAAATESGIGVLVSDTTINAVMGNEMMNMMEETMNETWDNELMNEAMPDDFMMNETK